MKTLLKGMLIGLLMLTSLNAAAEHIKNLASVLGVRENQLLG
jgi:flagellar basal body P-ring protein FlgI